ncbi:MAG TPA: DNA mismatch repair protein MutT [Bacteroidetes bacterium]|nr:DNA mismatch repair protein MutT [Bacteroidota bacterium]
MPLTPLPSEENPWTILDTEIKLDTPWVRCKLHKVINPSGSAGIYGVTEFKNLAIGILPIDEEENTYIVGQYRFPLQTYSWEIPEGGGPLHLDPLDSAKRELKEETGIEAANWELIQTLQVSNSATNEIAYLYLARQLSYGMSEPEEGERLLIRKIPFAELYERVNSGEISDSLTVAAVLKYRLKQLEGSLP